MSRSRCSHASRLVLCLCLLLGLSTPLQAQEHIAHGRFKDVRLYRPAGEPKQFVLLLSGDDGWERSVAQMARLLIDRGAMVAGIDVPQLFEDLEADEDRCVFPDGDLENLSHYVQGYARVPTYHTPFLIGYSSGATLAYAMAAQAPSGTFAGALTLGFCTDLELAKRLCRGEGVHFRTRRHHAGTDLLPAKRLPTPWIALQGADDQVCPTRDAQNFVSQVAGAEFILLPGIAHDYTASRNAQLQFLTAYDKLAAAQAPSIPPPPTSLADLPLIEVPAQGNGDLFAVLLSGDGGWAGLDKNVAAALAARGIAVVGLDSLRYFWTARTADGVARDIDRVLRYYAAHWNKSRALLIGYSQGADVLPFAVNRLPPAARSLVTQTVLMALSENAAFEFHLSSWLGREHETLPVRPEALKLRAATTLCLYGADDEDALCPKLPSASVHAQALPGGHHFDGAYDKLAELILARVSAR